jgi:hypothetical protein
MKRCLISYFLCGNPAKQFQFTQSAEKSGLGGCEMEDHREGGRGPSLSYVSLDV